MGIGKDGLAGLKRLLEWLTPVSEKVTNCHQCGMLKVCLFIPTGGRYGHGGYCCYDCLKVDKKVQRKWVIYFIIFAVSMVFVLLACYIIATRFPQFLDTIAQWK